MIDFWKFISEINANKEKAETLDKLGEVTTEITNSDKVGFNWIVYKVNGIEVSKEYVENGLAKGTQDNPIYFVEGISVTPNTFYYYNDTRYVYMGVEPIVAESWESVSEQMAEF